MPRGSKADEIAYAEIDMTPMIDVVFNLIIFFMLVNQMVQTERAKLELPVAEQAKADKNTDKQRLIINVHKLQDDVKNTRLEVAGRRVTWAELAKILTNEASKSRDESGASNRSVLIRGDVETQYQYIQRVMRECAHQRIYKLSFAAKKTKSK